MKVQLVNCVPLSVIILLGILPHWFHFRPLCELVDCNIQVLKAPDSAGEGAQYVEPQTEIDQERGIV